MNSFSALLNNAILLLVLCVVYDNFGVYAISNRKLRDFISGVIIGLISIAVMLNPWSLRPGVFFDTRWVLLSLCGLFFGPTATVVAVLIAGSFRLYQGGPGGLVGTLVVVVTACVGLAYRHWHSKNKKQVAWRQLYFFGVIVQLAMLSCMILMPDNIRWPIIKAVAPPILLIYPVITLLIGLILVRQESRRDAERELIDNRRTIAKERALLRNIIDTIPDLVYVKDINGKYTNCNKSFALFAGMEEEQIIGKYPSEFLGDEISGYIMDMDDAVIDNKRSYQYEAVYERSDGNLVVLDTVKAPFVGDDGTFHGLVGISRDITERRRALETLEENEEKYRRLIESTLAIPWELDLNTHKFTYIGPQIERILGVAHDSWLTMGDWVQSIIEEDRPRAASFCEKKSNEGLDHSFEYRMLCPNGSIRWIKDDVAVHVGENGPERLSGYMYDITAFKESEIEKVRLEEQLRHTQKMEAVGTLAGGIAHDFNNILGAVLGYTELSLCNSKCDEEIKENLEQVLSATIRAKDLVKQILMFSRKGEENFCSIQLDLVAEEAVNLLRHTIPSTIQINLDCDQGAAPVVADATQMHQIIMNLCTNASHAMPGQGGKIDINLKPVKIGKIAAEKCPNLLEGDYSQLTISDNGTGMSSETQSRIFEPFFTTKEQGKGTGMGLAVVHGIVRNHGGSILVESEEGKGTTFNVLLPASVKNNDAKEYGSTAKHDCYGTEHVLWVDDELQLVDLGKKSLEAFGYKVTSTISAKEALLLFKKNPDAYSLIITDQTMPEMTGDRLATEVMGIKPNIPVIICTGYSAVMDSEMARKIGVKDLIMKPVDMLKLGKTVRRVLDSVQ